MKTNIPKANTTKSRTRLLAIEPGWLTLQRRRETLDGATAADLLARGGALPGNLRYTRRKCGVVLQGDVPLDGEWQVDPARRRLRGWARGERRSVPVQQSSAVPDEEHVEVGLGESGLAWSRRDEVWVVPTTAGASCEIVIRAVPRGVRAEAVLAEALVVEAVLAEGSALAADSSQQAAATALAEYLCRAQGGLRFARCEMSDGTPRIVSWAEAEILESDLRHAVAAVAAGCELLLPQVRAFRADRDLARAYLEVVCGVS